MFYSDENVIQLISLKSGHRYIIVHVNCIVQEMIQNFNSLEFIEMPHSKIQKVARDSHNIQLGHRKIC